jgi:hypothetical protein
MVTHGFIPGSAIAHDLAFQVTGIVLSVLISVIGIRMCLYWASFFLRPGRYRQRQAVTTADLRSMPVPFVKVQFTTKGSPGSTEVILRGLRQLEQLCAQDPEFYARWLSAEVVTQNGEQAELIAKTFADSDLTQPDCVVVPASYATPNGTGLKARQMHYLTELRRAGWNRRPGKTFIVHWDEDTLMMPDEFRKMAAHLARTDKSILTGPIYYPLEYEDASQLARATEASRPITCFECRRVMESGVPLHVHGSNLVCEEEFENRLGWDIGQVDGQPFVAEDYMFGMAAFMNEGRQAFGWHGAVALEQPPFSFGSVFRQRYRWVFGVLQGMQVDTKLSAFRALPWHLRMKVIWGTRYRIATYALGSVVGGISLAYIPFALAVSVPDALAGRSAGIPAWLSAWFAAIGVMWFGSMLIGAWANVRHAGYGRLRRVQEILRCICITPVAGVMENLAALQAVVRWAAGRRTASWTTTPSTKAADDAVNGRMVVSSASLAQTVVEAPVPWNADGAAGRRTATAALAAGAVALLAVYIAFPVMLAAQSLGVTVGAALAVGGVLALGLMGLIMSIMGWTARATPPLSSKAPAGRREPVRPQPGPGPVTDLVTEEIAV